jgi:dTMP kinase
MKLKRGKFIVIEGSDGSGKTTQRAELEKKLLAQGIKIQTIKFPNYQSPTGDIVARYLGKPPYNTPQFGPSNDICPMIASTWYALDRWAHKKEIENALQNGIWVISDRYIESNLAHQGGKVLGMKGNYRKSFEEFVNWLTDLEYNHLKIPKADAVLYFYRTNQIGNALREKRAEATDGHESSKEHMENTEITYEKLAQILKWTKINCVSEGKMRSVQDISEEVWHHIKDKFL